MGGPVRMIVPEAYGNKCVKWLQRVELSNSYQADDTYATWNNDTESPMKTFARFLEPPKRARLGTFIPLVGYAQVGMSGLTSVQVALLPIGEANSPPPDNLNHETLPWKEAHILPPPAKEADWGGDLPDGVVPPLPHQFDPATGTPRSWPLPYTLAHWAALATAPQPGRYLAFCRTIDAHGIAQPMPRPLPRSGVNTIQQEEIQVEAG